MKFIVISGDNILEYYNEPEDMKNELIQLGIPAASIYLDYAGFRTLDSVIRCKEIFGQDSIVVVSQPFHKERAVFIALHKKIHAIAYNASDVSIRYGFKTQIRELFARVKLFIDLYITNQQPKFLGKKIEVK
jgi:SanA protein